MSTPANDVYSLIGKTFFFPRGNTFVTIMKVATQALPDFGYTPMTWKDLADGKEYGSNFVEEIGIKGEFQPIPDDYPREKIDAYLEAVKIREEVYAIMMDVENDMITFQYS